ncbi:MAG: xylulokinase [Actinomycetota bacterium]|nr:xylulokinase [Actinomycetota bacterium]
MLLGLDLGTGSAKALLISSQGEILGEGAEPYRVGSPHSGWAESDPEEWWNSVLRAARTAVGEHGDTVQGVGLSGQMHGVVLCEANGNPLRNAILWADARSGEQLSAYRNLDEDLLRDLANPITTGMAGPTLLWLRDHEPEVYQKAHWALQPKDWLRLRLTGETVAEPSDASATLLYSLTEDGWAFDVVQALGIRSSLLPDLVSSGSAAGEVTRKAAEALGVRAGITVAAGAGDTAAAMLGSGLLSAAQAQLTVGTGGQIVVLQDKVSTDPKDRTHLYRTASPASSGGAPWYSMAAIQNAGLALEWVRNVLGVSWDDVYEEAFSVPPGAEGVTFTPYLSGERTPHFDPNVRGAWTSLGLGHDRRHLLRAALEGVAFAFREGLEALEDGGNDVRKLRIAGGGSTDDRWRQMLSNVLRRPLEILPDDIASVASARGAALLAGAACGIYDSVEEAAPTVEPTRTVEPDGESNQYDEPFDSYKKIYPGLYPRPGL